MSNVGNSTSPDTISFDLTTSTSRSTVFSVYLALAIPSVPCSLFLLAQFIRKRQLCTQISNHVILTVLLCSFLQVIIELPIVLYNLRARTAMIRTDFFCKFWSWLDYSCNVSILVLMAFGSIERHMLVFHRNVLQKHVVIMHYLPIVLSFLYPFLLYMGLIFIHPCVNQFDFTMITCGGPCYLYEPTLSTFDQFANIALPVLIDTTANLTLGIRVLSQKRRMNQQRMWKKNRRLIIQLLAFVILHNIVWWPLLAITLVILYSPVTDPTLVQFNIDILPYGIYVVILLCPFVLILGLPEAWPRLFPRWIQRHGTTHIVRPAADQ